MRRWTLLGGLASLVGLLAAACIQQPAAPTAPQPEAPAPAQQTFTLKIQASWPSGMTLFKNLEMFKETVEKMSNGRLQLEILPAGAIVAAFEVLDATHKGVIDGAHTAPGYWVGKHWAAIPLSHGPLFGMDFVDMWGWYWWGGGVDLLNEWYRDVLKMNVVSFPILPAGPQAQGWFNKEIKGWEDFKGFKYRIYGIGAEVLQRAGMSTVTLPGAEIIPALERGVIDGAEWVTPAEDLRMGFQDVLKWYYMPGMHEQVTFGDLLINKDVWESLPPDLQEIIRVAARDTFIQWWTWFIRENAKALEELQTKYGVNVRRTPESIWLKWLEVYDDIIQEKAAEDPFIKKVLDSQRAYASLVVPARRFMFPPYDFLANYYWPQK